MNFNLEFDQRTDTGGYTDLKRSNRQSASAFIIYKERWLVLASFSVFAYLLFITAVPFVQYSGILSDAAVYYGRGTDETAIVWFSNVYYLDYILFGLFFITPVKKYLAPNIIFGAVLMVIGNMFIYFYAGNYWVAMACYVLFGVAQISQMIAPVFIADKWFPAHERTLATTLGILVTYMGLNYAFIFPAIYLSEPNDQSPATKTQRISTINLISLVISVLALLLTCLFTRSQPPTSPSTSAGDEKTDTLQSLKTFFRDATTFMDILTLSVCMYIFFIVVAGIAWSFITIISVLLDPFKYTQPQIGLIGFCFQLTGTISGILAALYIDKQIASGHTPSYDLLLRAFLSTSFVGIVLLSATTQLDSLALCCLLSGMVGFGLNAYFSIALQSMVEKLYPCSELAIASAMFLVAEIFGFASNFLTNITVLQPYGLWILTGIQAPFILYLIFFYKTELNRTKKESKPDQSSF